MPIIKISGAAQLFAESPASYEPVTDAALLQQAHGYYSQDTCSEYLDEPPLDDLGITAGRLRFVFDADRGELRITTTYQLPRKLSDEETNALVEATTSQWSDGIGSGSFVSHRGTLLSKSLAKAIQNGDPAAEVGDLFLEAYPFGIEHDVQVEYFDTGEADADLIADLTRAAESGDAKAQYQLGGHYENGDGVPQDDARAFSWYQKSAEQKDPLGATLAALCLYYGKGTEVDPVQAVQYFQQGAEGGSPVAMAGLAQCLQDGSGIEKDLEHAVVWLRRGAEHGYLPCLAELGEFYEEGKGVAKDLEKALECYETCLEEGFEDVQPAIERVRKQLG